LKVKFEDIVFSISRNAFSLVSYYLLYITTKKIKP
jgi:hypothetical protein